MAEDVRAEIARILSDVRTGPLTMHLPGSTPTARCFECGQYTGPVLVPLDGPDEARCLVCHKPRLYSCPSCSWTTGETLKLIGDEDAAIVHRVALDSHIRTRHDQHHMDPEQFVPVERITGAELVGLYPDNLEHVEEAQAAASWPFGIELVADDRVPENEVQLRSDGRVVGRIILDPS